MNKQKRREVPKTSLDNFYNRPSFKFRLKATSGAETAHKVAFEFLNPDSKNYASLKLYHANAIDKWETNKGVYKHKLDINDFLCDEPVVRSVICQPMRIYLISEENKVLMTQEFSLVSLIGKRHARWSFFDDSLTLKVKTSEKVLSQHLALRLNPLLLTFIPDKEFFTPNSERQEFEVEVENLTTPQFSSKVYTYPSRAGDQLVHQEEDRREITDGVSGDENREEQSAQQVNNAKTKSKNRFAIVTFLNDTDIGTLHDKLKSSLFTLTVRHRELKRLEHETVKPEEQPKLLKKQLTKRQNQVDAKDLKEAQSNLETKRADCARSQFRLNEIVEYSTRRYVHRINGRRVDEIGDNQFMGGELRVKLFYPFCSYLPMDRCLFDPSSELYAGLKAKAEVDELIKSEVRKNCKQFQSERSMYLNFSRAVVVIDDKTKGHDQLIDVAIKESNSSAVNRFREDQRAREEELLLDKHSAVEAKSKQFKLNGNKITAGANKDPKPNQIISKQKYGSQAADRTNTGSIESKEYITGFKLAFSGTCVYFLESGAKALASLISQLKAAIKRDERDVKVLYNSRELFHHALYSEYFNGVTQLNYGHLQEDMAPDDDAAASVLKKLQAVKNKQLFKEVEDSGLMLSIQDADVLIDCLPRPSEVYGDSHEKSEDANIQIGQKDKNEVDATPSVTGMTSKRSRVITAKTRMASDENRPMTQSKSQKVMPRDLNEILTHVLGTKKVKSALAKPDLTNTAAYKRANTVAKDCYKIHCKKDKERANPVYIYSQHKNNYMQEQVLELQKRVANDRNNHYTYSNEYLSLSVSPEIYLKSIQPSRAAKPDILIEKSKKIPKLDSYVKEELRIPFVQLHKPTENTTRHTKLLKNKEGMIFNRYFKTQPLFNKNYVNKEELEHPYYNNENDAPCNKAGRGGQQFDFRRPLDKERKVNRLKGVLEGEPVKRGLNFKKPRNLEQPPVTIFNYKDTSKPFVLRDNMSRNYFELFEQPERSLVYKPHTLNN